MQVLALLGPTTAVGMLRGAADDGRGEEGGLQATGDVQTTARHSDDGGVAIPCKSQVAAIL